MRDAGKINNRVAMVNVGDTFGIELANAARPVFKKFGFEIVYDKSYPLGTQDLTPVIKAGAGGIGNTAGFRDYLKRLKAGTGVDGDYWGTGVYGVLTQVLTQSIETVGADRHAVLKYIKSRTFDTLMGKLDLRKRNAPVWWTVGQWQDGVVEGVKGYGTSGGRKSGPHEIRLVAKFQPPSGGKIPGQAVLAWPGFLLPLTFILIPTNRI